MGSAKNNVRVSHKWFLIWATGFCIMFSILFFFSDLSLSKIIMSTSSLSILIILQSYRAGNCGLIYFGDKKTNDNISDGLKLISYAIIISAFFGFILWLLVHSNVI